jgi:hypothetical protein
VIRHDDCNDLKSKPQLPEQRHVRFNDAAAYRGLQVRRKTILSLALNRRTVAFLSILSSDDVRGSPLV